MRRVFVILATVLSLLATACGSQTITAGGELPPTPRPAPTIAGTVIEVEEPDFQAQTVFVGIPANQSVDVYALPGLNQPLVGDVPPGTNLEPLGEVFETEDGLVWWQVRAGDFQGWIQPNVAFQGPAQDVTDQALLSIGADTSFASAEDAASAVALAMEPNDETSLEVVVVDRTEIESQGSATVTADLLGLQDDSLLGFRFIVAATGNAAGDWRPVSVIQLTLCARGVSPDGLCL